MGSVAFQMTLDDFYRILCKFVVILILKPEALVRLFKQLLLSKHMLIQIHAYN